MRILFNLGVNTSVGYYNNSSANSVKTNYQSTKLISFGASEDTFNFDEKYKENLDKRSGFKKFFGMGKKKAYNKTVDQLTGFNIDRNSREKMKDETIAAQRREVAAKDEVLKVEREKQALLQQQLADAKANGANAQKIIELEKKLNAAYDVINSKNFERDVAAQKLKKMEDAQEILVKRQAGKGWDRIAGNESIKTELEEWFINKLAVEKGDNKVTFPNGILFYGPQSTGKTAFAKAFAEQSKCNYIEIDMGQFDDDDILSEINIAKEQAKKHYKKTGERTILLLDEFDSIAQLDDETRDAIAQGGKKVYDESTVGKIEKFLSNCSEEYKCTAFMTTNHPLDIEADIFKNKKCIPYHVYLGAPNADDVEEIFKYYLKGFTQEAIDYDNVIGEMVSVIETQKPGHAFSAGQIKEIVTSCRSDMRNITENDLISTIRRLGPDITPEMLKRFGTEVLELGKKLC